MHGTFVNDDRLGKGEIKRLENNDLIQFGSKVTRASGQLIRPVAK